jgi:hypothetical protein
MIDCLPRTWLSVPIVPGREGAWPMNKRPTSRFRPGLEPLEAKRPLAAGPTTALTAATASATMPAAVMNANGNFSPGDGTITAKAVKPNFGYLVYRITNPSGSPNTLTPPFGHVLVQARQPVPGQVYNILQVAVKNGTRQTFDANSRFQVRLLQSQPYFPILTGNETWKPGQDFIFYVLTKKYYPLANQVSQGFRFKLDGAWSTAIPGPSGIFLRVKYDPATINKILDYAVTRGPGAQGGKGIPTGMADTAIFAFASAKEHRNDFGGYF